MNNNWKFIRKHVDSAWQQYFDDSSWETINIPHDYSITEDFSIDNSSGTGYLPGGVAWYRRAFKIAPETEYAQVEFDGIYNNAMIWVNGYYMGIYENGYVPIKLDITKVMKEDNAIAIRVDHESVSDSRWYTGSGIYRNCTLREFSGPYIREEDIKLSSSFSKNSGLLKIDGTVNNLKESSNAIIRIYDKDDVISEKKFLIGTENIINTEMLVNNVVAWDAVNPKLYSVEISIEDNPIYKSSIGFVTYDFNPQMGFMVNGSESLLKGVCIHHDAGCLGAAVPKMVWRLRLEKLKEAGVNAIRFSHNPHSKELFELCDEMGFYVIAELFDEWEGAKNKWSQGHNVYPPKHDGYAKYFKKNYKSDIKNVVLRDRNQTSLIMWSIGNEIDYPNDPYVHESLQNFVGNNDANKPQEELIYNSGKPDMSYLKELSIQIAQEVRKHDEKTALTIALAFPELSMKLGLGEAMDVVGFNYKEHLYEEMQELHKDKCFIGSENSHSLEAWNYVLETKGISGQFLWTGYDFIGETTVWPKHGSSAGLIRVSNIPKFEYFVRKSWWTNEDVLEVYARKSGDEKDVQKNWNFEIGEEIEVFCACSSSKITFKLGNEVLDVSEELYNHMGYYKFQIIYDGKPLIVSALNNEKTLSKNTEFSHITVDKIKEEDGIGIYEVTAVDKNNELYINPVTLKVNGRDECLIMGLENGNLFDTSSYKHNYRETFEGKLMVYVKLSETNENKPFEIEIVKEKNE